MNGPNKTEPAYPTMTLNSDHSNEKTPLIIDVDGTLLSTDMLYESFWAALGESFFTTLLVVLTSLTSPAKLKRRLLDIARPVVELLPQRPEVLDLATNARHEGRPVHLVSGSDQSLVDELAASLGLEGPHYGSDGKNNLTQHAKAAFLAEKFGPQIYDYVGDSSADLPVWANARKVIAIAPSKALKEQIARLDKPTAILPNAWGLRDVFKELRPHQWVKNILLFLPLLVAHDLSQASLATAFVAAIAFSLGASSIYILNDMLDLEADRRHPEKRNRPIASGRLPIKAAMAISTILVILSLGLSWSVAPSVAVMTFAYMLSSLIYSLYLKKLVWVDLLTLASLFLLRVLTGAVATGSDTPLWLIGFVFATFFSLACVKRITALARAFKGGHLPGRGYNHSDAPRLQWAAFGSIGLSAICFAGYAFSPAAAALYSTPWLLLVALCAIVLWQFRVVRLSQSGKEDYDPVVLVTRDPVGLAIAAAAIICVILAV